ncbi:MAG: pyridoxal phosphate-dependent aminotransferase family protein [Flavobacteriaceae bacterium]|jgi:8-amino-7-oxononanoate synthase|nr:pyridoxal phosphate-dependent aminotransferase family protein [Flavobacteriaceae bacterium]
MNFPKRLEQRLADRQEQGNYRMLKQYPALSVDFFSNDYLGLSRSEAFQQQLVNCAIQHPETLCSSTGSRLISGNTQVTEQVEQYIAQKHQVEAALLFNSGYQANLALFGNLLTSRDTVLVDEYIHRSIHDGCSVSKAKKWKFKHNDLTDLERLLKQATGDVYIAVESLYSMDGDIAPLEKLIVLSTVYGAHLIVDEAHAIGVYGWGLLHQNNKQQEVFAHLVTYGKAMGVHGAAILGSYQLQSALVNFASPFIYSTAPVSMSALSIREAYKYVEQNQEVVHCLHKLIEYYQQCLPLPFVATNSPIQLIALCYLTGVEQLLQELKQAQLNVCVIKAPTVARGTERLRICLHSYNTTKQIDQLIQLIIKYANTNSTILCNRN